METIDKNRNRRLKIMSFIVTIVNALNLCVAYLSFTAADQLYFNQFMIITLIDKVISLVIAIIKNQYQKVWILDLLNLSFLVKYTDYYFPEQQRMISYCIYLKIIPSLIIQLFYKSIKRAVFISNEGNLQCFMMISFQLNILLLYLLINSLFINSQEFDEAQLANNNQQNIKSKSIFDFKNLFNIYCLYNMWVVVLTQQQTQDFKYNLSVWAIISFSLLVFIELKQGRNLKSLIYALTSFELNACEITQHSFYEIVIRKFNTIRLYIQLLLFFILSNLSYILKKQEVEEDEDKATFIYQNLFKTLVLLNLIFSLKNIIQICRKIKVDINCQNKIFSRLVDITVNDQKSSHFIILTNLSFLFDFFEIDNTVRYQQDEEKAKVPEIDFFYMFSKIFEIIHKRDGSILIQSLLKGNKQDGITILDKNFKLNHSIQMSLLCNAQHIPESNIFDIELNQELCNKIVLDRFSTGILFNEKILQQNLADKQNNLFLAQNTVLQTSQLQINAFNKQLQYLVINNPSQVLYDLYEN